MVYQKERYRLQGIEEGMEATYYTCLNQHCPKHRGIFLDGDPEHADCERRMFRLEDHPRPRGMRRIILPVLGIAGAVAAFLVLKRRFS